MITDRFIARTLLAFIFIYHGLIPKIIFPSATEKHIILAHHFPVDWQIIALGAGVAEIFLGLTLLLLRNSVWPVRIALFLLILLLIDVAIFVPALLIEAFNPVTSNLAAIGLCFIALRSNPSAGTRAGARISV